MSKCLIFIIFFFTVTYALAEKPKVRAVLYLDILQATIKSSSNDDYILSFSVKDSLGVAMTVSPFSIAKQLSMKDALLIVSEGDLQGSPANLILDFNDHFIVAEIRSISKLKNQVNFKIKQIGLDKKVMKNSYRGRVRLFIDDETLNTGITGQFMCSSAMGENSCGCFWTSLVDHPNETYCDGYSNPSNFEKLQECLECGEGSVSECQDEYSH